MTDWIKIRNDYINGNISYRKLAEKHNVSFSTLQTRAREEKWFEKRKVQHDKINEKIVQKTAEKLAEKEANRLLRISAAADKLLEKIELATQQLDLYLTKDKRRYTTKAIDPQTKQTIDVYVEEEVLKEKKVSRIDKAGLKQIASTLKDLRDLQFTQNDEKSQESPNINITISAATPDDMRDDEEDNE